MTLLPVFFLVPCFFLGYQPNKPNLKNAKKKTNENDPTGSPLLQSTDRPVKGVGGPSTNLWKWKTPKAISRNVAQLIDPMGDEDSGGWGSWGLVSWGGGLYNFGVFFFLKQGKPLPFWGRTKKRDGWNQLCLVVFIYIYIYIYMYIYIYIPGTYLSSIFSLGPSKTRVFPIKTRGPIWVPGVCIYIYILVTFIARNPCSQLLHFMVSHFFSFSWGLQSFETSSAKNLCGHTFDGPEILRSPVEVGSLSHYLRRVLAPSQVVFWDF